MKSHNLIVGALILLATLACLSARLRRSRYLQVIPVKQNRLRTRQPLAPPIITLGYALSAELGNSIYEQRDKNSFRAA